ncbi:MAG: glycosyltransferase family 39 protein, partial [Candidatus Omnitrophota bacterium]
MSLESRPILKRSDLFDRAFAFLLLFALATNLVWFLNDNHILGDGSQDYLKHSIELFQRFSSIANSALPILEKITAVVRECSGPGPIANTFWPLGFHFSTCFFYSVAGTTLFAAKLNLLPYLFILLLSTYCIGKHIDSRPAGLVAAASLFFYPIIFQSSRQYQLDFPLTTMVALGALFLLKSEQFRNMKFSLLFGVASGWAMLIKGQYAIFMTLPL